jgi:hypothetical protein
MTASEKADDGNYSSSKEKDWCFVMSGGAEFVQ